MKYDAESIYQKYCKNFNLNEGQVEVIKRLLEWTYSKGKWNEKKIAPRTWKFKYTNSKTRSGKIMRRLLKAKELGQDVGDLSVLDK